MSMTYLFPTSHTPDDSGEAFPSVHVANSRKIAGLGLAASITLDRKWFLSFRLPEVMPTGTPKLKIVSLADADTGTVVVEPQWAFADDGEDWFNVTVNLEGDTTITWGASDNHKDKVTKIPLDAASMAGKEGQRLGMVLKFDATSTLAVVSTHAVFVIWE